MTKKILALALAGTTAFSVFASAMSVNATAYTWQDTEAYGGEESFDATKVATVVLPAVASIDGAVVAKIDTSDITSEYFAYDNTKYYISDLVAPTGTGAADKVTAVKNAVKAAKKLTATAYDALPGTGTDEKKTLEDAITAAYGATPALRTGNAIDNDKAYRAALDTLYSNFKTVSKYMNAGNTAADESKVAAKWDIAEFDAYDAEKLFKAIYDIVSPDAGAADDLYTAEIPYSYVLFLNKEYTRIITNGVGARNNTDDIELYEHFLEAASILSETDYTEANWASIVYQIALAKADAKDGDYEAGAGKLQTALDTEPKKGDISALRDTILSMYSDTKGNTKTSYIVSSAGYIGGTNNTIYKKNDYIEGRTYTDEWKALFSDPIWYYNPLDAVDEKDATGYVSDGIYGYAYKLWTDSKVQNVAQSKIDVANELLTEALAALDPTNTSPEWEILKLERTINLAESLQPTDFNTGSSKWKTFEKNLARAQSVLDGTAAGRASASAIADALNQSMIALKDVRKQPSYALKKEFRDILKDAKAALKALTDQQGAQYKQLDTAVKAAEKVEFGTYGSATFLDVEGKTGLVSLISDYQEAIDEMTAAMNYYEQPQGWYEGEGGWMYGEGDSYVVSDWKKVGTKWFYFEDGVAVESNWRQIGGKYYYFNQYCVALTNCWGKVDGGWYYFGADSAMKTGWLQIGTTWYYLNPTSGRMMTGWVSVNGKSYYFNADGAMLTSTTTPDGYEVGADGAWIQK